MCFIKDGNVAVYRGTTLLAIVYGLDQPRAEADEHVSPTAVVASTPIPHTARLWRSPGAGTGRGYCSFHYQRDDEHTDLSISSVGEEFRVDDYNAECNDAD